MSRLLVIIPSLILVGAFNLLVSPPAVARASGSEEFAAEVSAYLKERAENGEFSGTVMIAKDGEAILREAHGLASRAFGVPIRIDTKFNLGSMNKMFTGVAIAQLAERELISFDDRIIDHIPDYPNREIAEKVTIHQLLTHTSGMGNYWTEEYMKTSKDRFRDVSDYLPLFVDQPLLFEPGTDWSYSNSGFMVLGLIIESVTGQSYFDYVMKNVYQPAGMVNTNAYELDYVIPNLAVGYTRMGAREGEWKNNLFLHVVKGGPAGGGYSTVEDLIRFGRALLDHKLLGPEFTERVIEGKIGTDRETRSYGYGFRNRTENGHTIIGHSGGFPGINSYLDIYLDLGYSVAIMSNVDMGATELQEFIMSRLVGKTRDMINRELTEAVLERIVKDGYDAGVTLYEERKGEGTVLERRINDFGYALLQQGKVTEAIDVFRFNVYVHPESSNCFDSLGEAYMVYGNRELAIKNYERSVELDPGNVHGKEMLEKLKKN
jgi:CubicO group peptidase (beta-lactamase class C family)